MHAVKLARLVPDYLQVLAVVVPIVKVPAVISKVPAVISEPRARYYVNRGLEAYAVRVRLLMRWVTR